MHYGLGHHVSELSESNTIEINKVRDRVAPASNAASNALGVLTDLLTSTLSAVALRELRRLHPRHLRD